MFPFILSYILKKLRSFYSPNLGISGRSAHPNPNRGAVMHCPYCGGENLWPDAETDYAWECRECCRVFTVKLHGQVERGVA